MKLFIESAQESFTKLKTLYETCQDDTKHFLANFGERPDRDCIDFLKEIREFVTKVLEAFAENVKEEEFAKKKAPKKDLPESSEVGVIDKIFVEIRSGNFNVKKQDELFLTLTSSSSSNGNNVMKMEVEIAS
jgi:hypothetical protein